jgi:hypothetical protein
MKKNYSLLITALFILFVQYVFSQEEKHWTQDLNIKVSYGTNFGFNTDLNVIGFKRYTPDNGTFRLGIGKDFQLSEKWSLQSAIELDWIRSDNRYLAEPSSTGFDRAIGAGSTSSSGSDLQYTISLPFNYNVINNKNDQLGLAFGPELNFNFQEVMEGGGFGIGENSSIARYDEVEFDNTVFRPSALFALNYQTKFGNLPVRAQAFFSYSITHQYSGTFQYTNGFNGEAQRGDFEMQGHKAGLSLAFFPFNNGDPNKKEEKIKEKKIKKERSDAVGSSRFGFKAGVNFSDVTGTDFITQEDSGYAGTAPYGGFFVDTKITEKWSIQNELTFSFTDVYTYIEIPVLLKRRFTDKWSAFAGPNLIYVFDYADSFDKNFGIGLDFGLQYDLPKDFFIEARYGVGFTEHFNENFLGIENAKRNVLRVGLGIKF